MRWSTIVLIIHTNTGDPTHAGLRPFTMDIYRGWAQKRAQFGEWAVPSGDFFARFISSHLSGMRCMKSAMRWMIAMLVVGSMASGQQESHAQVKVVTVCEVLADVDRHAGSAVVVVGRMEHSVSLTDQYQFLSEDQCEHPVITHGHVWSNKIQVWAGWGTGMPRPPRAKLQLEQSVLAAKLLAVRQTTKLGTHYEPYFKNDRNSIVYGGLTSRPNEWAVVYGRITRMPRLNENCGVGGCGGDNVPLMLIAEPYNVHRIAEDGRLVAK